MADPETIRPTDCDLSCTNVIEEFNFSCQSARLQGHVGSSNYNADLVTMLVNMND